MHPHTEAVKRWRDKKQAEGKCICGPEKRPGKSKCQICADNAIAHQRKQKFGVDREQHAAMLEAQGHACALCGCEADMSSPMDHSHETSRARGILCRSWARTIKIGPPPREFATQKMTASKFYSMRWSGEVQLTDQVLISYPDGSLDLNVYGT